jgi:hypothetical protein
VQQLEISFSVLAPQTLFPQLQVWHIEYRNLAASSRITAYSQDPVGYVDFERI